MTGVEKVLILCTGNSARSQMAEGLLRELGGERFSVASAGTHPSQVHPMAIEVMRQRGIDISHHRSKHLSELLEETFDTVITVCDRARQACPVFPGKVRRLHWSLPDPAAATGDRDARMTVFRRVRDELESRLREWLGSDPAREEGG